jgi:hypothetical protein
MTEIERGFREMINAGVDVGDAGEIKRFVENEIDVVNAAYARNEQRRTALLDGSENWTTPKP